MDNYFTLVEKDYNTDEIFDILSKSEIDDFEKIFAIININPKEKLSKNDFKIFINHLTNQPTPIREITALKLEEAAKFNKENFLDDFSISKILDGIIDINPNISRAVCNIISINPHLKLVLEDKIIVKIENLIAEIKKYEEENKDFFDSHIRNTKNHAKNKKLFALYWLLEALSICISEKNREKILKIITYTINFKDYTIREKTAKILHSIQNPPIDLVNKIKEDVNFYVKNQVYDKIEDEID